MNLFLDFWLFSQVSVLLSQSLLGFSTVFLCLNPFIWISSCFFFPSIFSGFRLFILISFRGFDSLHNFYSSFLNLFSGFWLSPQIFDCVIGFLSHCSFQDADVDLRTVWRTLEARATSQNSINLMRRGFLLDRSSKENRQTVQREK